MAVPFEFVISGHCAGQFTQTILHASVTPSGSPDLWSLTSDLALSLILTDGLVDTFCKALPQQWIGSSLRVRQLSPAGPSAYQGAGGWDSPNGIRDGGISSAQVNPVCVWVPTSQPAKTGRTFLPGVSEDDIDSMIYTTDYMTAVGTFMATFVGGGSFSSGIWIGCVYRRETATMDVLQGAYLSPHVGTQRRRLLPV